MKRLSWLNKPVMITAIYMVLLYGLAMYGRIDKVDLAREGLRVGMLFAGFLIPHLLVLFLFGARPRMSNMLITLLILAVLADFDARPWMVFSLGLITAVVKTLIRVKNQPVFNPAAAGLMIMAFAGMTTTWWGVSFAPRLPIFNMSVAMLLTLPVGLFLVAMYKKLPTLIGVVGAFAGVYFILAGKLPLVIMFEGTFAFFLLFMATEPKTTPLVDWQEWIYGLVLGGALAILFVEKWVSAPYLTVLLASNIVFSGYKWVQLKLA